MTNALEQQFLNGFCVFLGEHCRLTKQSKIVSESRYPLLLKIAEGAIAGHDRRFLASIMAVVGLMLGSFATVLIHRLPRKEKFIKGRSQCPSCNEPLAPIDLIPVFTWLFLRGRCRHCKTRISIKYPLIELTSCLIAVSVINQHGASIASVVLALSCIGLAITATIDALTRRLPNRAIITIAIFELIGFFADALVNDSWQDFRRAALVAILATGVALIFYFVSRGGLGEGDVKFAPIVWFPLGWLGWGAAFGAYLIAAVIAVLWTVVFGIMQRRIRKVSIPLGPALALGAIITIIADFSWKAGV